MSHPELAMSAHLQLALLSHQKRQVLPRNKFLVLTGIAACEAGRLDIAAECRKLILQTNARHLLGRYLSFPDALRDADFQDYRRQLVKFCSFERAEMLLANFQRTAHVATDDEAHSWLQEMHEP